jgi:hypothetical protein
VIFYDPYDPDPTVSERRGGAHRESVDGEVSAALEVDGEGDLGVLDVGEVQEGIQLEVARALAKWRRQKFPAAMMRDGWRLVP